MSETFENLKKLHEEVKQTVDINKVHIFVVGNKNDLYDQEKVPKTEAEQYAKSISANYRCVSALKSDGGGVNELFETLGKNLITNKFCERSTNTNADGDKKNIVLTKKNAGKDNKNQKKKKCC